MKRRILSGLFSLLFVLSFVWSSSFMQQEAKAAPDYSKVRVKLSNANDGTLNLTFNGIYSIDSNGKSISGAVVVSQSGGNLKIADKASGATLFSGSKTVYIKRADDQQGKAGLVRMFNTNHNWRNYLGDFSITVSGENSFQVVNHVPMEHYLYGVVAYEMNDNFPIEALKAQAIAARGYVAGRIGSYSKYDLGDTPSDQVYKGYDPSYKNVIAAVDATKGQILTHNGRVVLPYYAASNGGQTELTGNIWNQSLAYCPMKDDPYDLRNPNSLKQTIFFPETVSATTPLDSKLANYLKIAVAPMLQEKGLSTYADQMEILGISNLEAYESKYAAPSRSYTKAKADVRVRAVQSGSSNGGLQVSGSQQGAKPVKPVFEATGINSANGPLFRDQNGTLCDAETMQWYLEQYEAALAEWESGNISLENSGLGMTGSTQDVTVSISFDIYDLKSKNLGYRLFNNDNLRMYWSEKVDGGANLVNVRFGHGVGMSQRGAQQMAEEGKSYQEIMEFYYSNCKLEQFNYNTPRVSDVSPASGQVDSSVDTGENDFVSEIPVEEDDISETIKGRTNKKVSLYASTSAKTSKSSLKANVTVDILAQQGDWVLIGTSSGVTGLVKAKDILVDSAPALARKAANLTASAGAKDKIGSIAKNEPLTIVERSGSYYRILKEDGSEGYVAVSAIQILVENPQLSLGKKINYGQSKSSIKAYTSTAKKKVAYTIPEGEVFVINSKTKSGNIYNISYNGKKGYINASGAKILKKGSMHPNVTQVINSYFKSSTTSRAKIQVSSIDETNDAVHREDAEQFAVLPVISLDEQGSLVSAYAQLSYPGKIKGDTVNLRKEPSSNSSIIKQLPNGDSVRVFSQNGNYYKVQDSNGNTGYIGVDYVTINTDKIGTITANDVNLRSGPSEGAEVVQKLQKNDTVEILGASGKFFKVKTGAGNTGYVSDEFCKVMGVNIPKTGTSTTNSSSNSSSNTTSSSSKKAVASGKTKSEVNLRKSASTSSEVLAVIPKGTRVNIFSKKNNFYRVEYQGKTGYVAMSYIPSSSLQKPVSTSTTTSNNTTDSQSSSDSITLKKLAVVKADVVNVRSPSGTKLGVVLKDDVVEVLGSSGNKYKILKGSLEGYVEDSFIVVVKSRSGKATETVNMRKEASSESTKLGQVPQNTTVQIVSSTEKWTRVYYKGTAGYVLTECIKFN